MTGVIRQGAHVDWVTFADTVVVLVEIEGGKEENTVIKLVTVDGMRLVPVIVIDCVTYVVCKLVTVESCVWYAVMVWLTY